LVPSFIIKEDEAGKKIKVKFYSSVR